MTCISRNWLALLLVVGPAISAGAMPFENPVHDAWNPALSPAMIKDFSIADFGDTPDLYHSYDVNSYDLNISFDVTTSAIAGTSTVVFTAMTDNFGTLILDAVDMEIKGVRWSDGSLLMTTYDQKQLKITLPYAMQKGMIGTLMVEYSSLRPQAIKLASADATRRDRVNTAYTFTEPDGSRRWFPCHDLPSDKTITTMTFSTPQNFVVASNGDEYEIGRSPDGRRRFRFHTGVNIATYLTSVVLGPIDSLEIGRLRNIPLSLSAPSYLMPALRKETSRTLQMMLAFERFTQTAYGFQKYRQTVAEGYSGSMEHQSVTTMGGSRVVGDMSGEAVVAHELAHQWFGDLVTCGIWGDLWLNEGFASYLPFVFYDAMGERDRLIFEFLGSRNWYFGLTTKDNARAISTADEWPNYNIFDQHSYAKAALVIHLFRNIANSMAGATGGVEPFSKALGLYLHQHAYGNGRYFDLQKALEQVTGASWKSLFDQWILSKGHPDVRVTWAWDEAKKELALDLTQTQMDPNGDRKWGAFSFPLAIRTVDDQGQSKIEHTWVEQEKHTFKFKADRTIVGITVDPAYVVPGIFTVVQSPEAYGKAFAAAKSPTEQAVLTEELARSKMTDQDIASGYRHMMAQTSDVLALTLIGQRLQGWDAMVEPARELLAKLKDKQLNGNERAAIAQLEPWLIKKSKPEDRPSFAVLAQKWQETFRVEERESLIDAMRLVDVQATHRFALAELAKAKWTDRDRASLASTLASATTDVSRPFILEMLKDTHTINIGMSFLNAATSSKFNDPAALPLLINGATTHQNSTIRSYYVRLIPNQKQDQKELCEALKTIMDKSNATGTATDKAIVSGEVKAAEAKLKCP